VGRERTCMDMHTTPQTCTGTAGWPASELLTLPATANRLAISVRSLYRLIERDELTVIRILPDAPRIRAADLDALIARRLAEDNCGKTPYSVM
jgi:hypothetical protein